MIEVDRIAQIVEKWEPTGLLNDLSTSDKIRLSQYLEFAAGYMIKRNVTDQKNHSLINGIIFPAIKRSLNKLDETSLEPFIEHLYTLSDKINSDYQKIKEVFPNRFPFDFENHWMDEYIK